LERTLVELVQQFPDGAVQLPETEELAMPQSGHDPALGNLHAHLDLGFGKKRALQMVTKMAHKFSP
ncbi:MAG TPA: hypothetical protein VI320_24615, partial [Terracidiphilus sp.]